MAAAAEERKIIMPEQPSKFICELCGGTHPTSEHERITIPSERREVTTLLPEKELSPETVEKILDKVEDINQFEIAVHTVGVNNRREINLKDILKDGILGISTMHSYERLKTDFDQRKKWMIAMREKHELPKVWFDVVGDHYGVIKNCHYIRFPSKKPLNLTIIFDLSKYHDPIGARDEFLTKLEEIKEAGSLDPEKDFEKQNTKLGNYMPADEQGPNIRRGGMFAYAEERRSDKARGVGDTGRVLFGRIPPRYFRGIVFQYFMKKENSESYTDEEETDPGIIQEKVIEIAKMMLLVDKNKPELLLPIYGTGGNLLWPKQMSYEEVQKHVAEKLKSKEPESSPAPPVTPEQTGKKEGV